MSTPEKPEKEYPEAAIPECFIIMPITDPEGYEDGHFRKVYEDIFKIACKKSGYRAIRADDVKETNLIHLDILRRLVHSPMAICDLSSRNPNVLFELGLRQAFDKPTVLVQECGTPKIFDISPLRTTDYRKELKYREVLEDQEFISDALTSTAEAIAKDEGINSIIGLLSLSSPATLKETSDNDTARMMQIIMSEMNDLRTDFKQSQRQMIQRTETNAIDPKVAHYFQRAKVQYFLFDRLIKTGEPFEKIKRAYDEFIDLVSIVLVMELPFKVKDELMKMRLIAESEIAKSVADQR